MVSLTAKEKRSRLMDQVSSPQLIGMSFLGRNSTKVHGEVRNLLIGTDGLLLVTTRIQVFLGREPTLSLLIGQSVKPFAQGKTR